MKWLPYDSWTTDSPLDAATLAAGMRRRIEPTKWFRQWRGGDHTPLEGRITARGFSARRVIHYRNSFLPMLYGKFIPTLTGTRIRVRMMLHPVVIVFLACWFGFLGLFVHLALFDTTEGPVWGALLLLGFMGVFAVALTYGAFFWEAGRTKKLLLQVLLEVHEEAAGQGVRREGGRLRGEA